MISLIAAIDDKKGIGKLGTIPWSLSEDDNRFEDLTKNHTIIMDAHRFEAFGKALEHRKNIVVTQDPNFTSEGVIVVNTIEEAIGEAGGGEIFVIGGAQIFNQTIEYADKIYLTHVEGDFGCDSFFPDYSQFANEVFIGAGQENNIKYKFLELTK
jgi:dihydrofolate reductase